MRTKLNKKPLVLCALLFLAPVTAWADNANGEAPEAVRVKTRERYEIQLQRRLALPAAPLLFALVGIPLGMRRSRGARSFGVLLCVILVFAYYAFLSAGTYFAEENLAPAWTALWIPNLLFAIVAVVLLRRARRAEI